MLLGWPLLFTLACARPPVDRWEGCLVDDARPVKNGQGPGLVLVDAVGSRALVLGTAWGGLPLITDGRRFGSLWLALLPEGASNRERAERRDILRGAYTEGGQRLVFSSYDLTGQIQIDDLQADTAVIELDLRARHATVDRSKRGTVPLQGTVHVGRGKGQEGARCLLQAPGAAPDQ